ncbi:recombination mediator RecR [Patescibacteria group bacterium]
MNILPKNVQQLIQYLQRIPGLGPKSAARTAMYLLKTPKSFTSELGDILKNLKKDIVYCDTCFNIASADPCDICSNQKRDKSIICVVEDPLDVLAFENGTEFEGIYHVLGGVISPVNGIGPEELTIQKLLKRVGDGDVRELIIATNPNIEGEATAMYIKQELKTKNEKLKDLKITRLARGLPNGADLEYADKNTLKGAFEGRTDF